ncbi:MAG: hypothetical protein SNG10_01310 [Rikenellaceae bacterium]
MKNRVIITLALLLCCCVYNLSAQDNSKSLEREVKISGNYYYGDGSSSDESEALQMAIEELKIMISEDLRLENPEVSTVSFNGFDDSIGTISIDLDSYVRVISFSLRSDISYEIQGGKSMIVSRVSSNSDVAESSEPAAPTPTPAPAPVVAAVVTAPVVEPVVETPKIEEPKIEEPRVEEPRVEEPQVQEVKANTETIVAETTTTETKTDNAIINEILKLTESKDVGVLLDKYKNLGKLGYGRLSTITNPESCYFVVLRSGKLVDVLDLGSTSTRMGLISGTFVNYSKSYDMIYWIYMY